MCGRFHVDEKTLQDIRKMISFSKQLLINARAESALAKRMFSESVLRRRCAIPAARFYEWDKNKNKVTFSKNGQSTIYMAGFYIPCEEENRFVILTTDANDSMRSVHDRMPLILAEDELKSWIYDTGKVSDFLKKESPQLEKKQEYEQLSFSFDEECEE